MLKESIVNSENHDSMEIEEKAKMIERPEDAAKVIQEFEEIISTNKKNIVWLAYQQGKTFHTFKSAKTINEFVISRSTVPFKIVIVGLKCQYLK